MNHVLSIARKELASFFRSSVAIIFLALFLGFVLFDFFWVGKFFARNLADVRPLFEKLPRELILLVAALSMRLWAEERKSGTIEILLTLPVPHWKLVLGKFLAGMVVIALALALTLGLPITVSMMGDLDWGPVFGGYLAALLLAAAYLSIGLCISAATDSQLLALILTICVYVLLHVPGVDAVVRAVGGDAGEVLRAVSTGGRFESIARGVLDLRDLAYFVSLAGLGLVVNIVMLRSLGWGHGRRTASQRFNQKLAVALVAANAVAFNLWMAPVSAARVDLTENNIYSLSPVTEKIVSSLDQPLLIRGYFSEKTHPLLAPLVPQIEDILAEYKVIGGKNMRVEIVDPASSEEVEKEAQERYGIKSFPFRFADRREQSVVNAYFHLLVQYGDQYEVLTFEDLIEVRQTDIGQLEVKLRNFEYDVTRTIKKVAYGFQSLDVLFASLANKAELTAYITPDSLPENLRSVPDTLKKVVDRFEQQAGGNFTYRVVEPKTREEQRMLYQKYGFQPFAVSLLSNKGFYLHFVLTVGKKEIPILPPVEVNESSLEQALVEGLKRAAPGFIKTVALWTPPAEQQQPQIPGMPPPRPHPPQSFETLRDKLRGSYEVVPANLSSGHVDDEVEVLIVAGPANLGAEERKAVDQFVMRGGALILLDGRFRLDLMARSLKVEEVKTGLEDVLEAWGITVQPKLVLDTRNDSFPIPVDRDLGGLVVRDVQQMPYPFFVHVPRDGMSDGIITGQLAAAVMHFASPIEVKEKLESSGKGGEDGEEEALPRKVEVLLESSDEAWLQSHTTVQPDFRLYPSTGFGKPKDVPKDERGPHVLAVAITGSFPSALAPSGDDEAAEDKASGDQSGDAKGADSGEDEGKSKNAKANADKDKEAKADADKDKGDGAKADADGDEGAKEDGDEPAERLIRRSPPDSRIVVVGSSSFVSDELLQVSEQAGADYVLNNVEMVQNMVDWAVADTDLLTIRSRGSHTRLLEIEPDARGRWEWINYGIMIVGLGVIIALTALRQRSQVPIELTPRKREGEAAGGEASKEDER